MGIYKGSADLSNVLKGNTEISAIYKGDKEIWSAGLYFIKNNKIVGANVTTKATCSTYGKVQKVSDVEYQFTASNNRVYAEFKVNFASIVDISKYKKLMYVYSITSNNSLSEAFADGRGVSVREGTASSSTKIASASNQIGNYITFEFDISNKKAIGLIEHSLYLIGGNFTFRLHDLYLK